MHLLVSRIDALGDVCLTLPALGWIKELHPDWKISLLVRPYTQALVASSRWIDEVIVWGDEDAIKTRDLLIGLYVDHVIHISPHKVLARAAKQAGIPIRSGVWGRPFHWLNCNNRIALSRARSAQHEAYLNVRMMGKCLGIQVPTFEELKRQLVHWTGLSHLVAPGASASRDVVLHPYSRGSGREWPITYFAALAHLLKEHDWQPVLGGTIADLQVIEPYRHLFPEGTDWAMGRYDIAGYMLKIANSAGLVASGTGPLHMANVLGRPAVGLFPPHKNINAQRWGSIGPHGISLFATATCAQKCSNQDCACMREISAAHAFQSLEMVLPHG